METFTSSDTIFGNPMNFKIEILYFDTIYVGLDFIRPVDFLKAGLPNENMTKAHFHKNTVEV
jgi:hypothetical protein